MSAVPEDLMRPEIEIRVQRPKPLRREGREADTATQKFWQWFAILALLFCWIAEATMCAERGF